MKLEKLKCLPLLTIRYDTEVVNKFLKHDLCPNKRQTYFTVHYAPDVSFERLAV
jgi:hypothetical protein